MNSALVWQQRSQPNTLEEDLVPEWTVWEGPRYTVAKCTGKQYIKQSIHHLLDIVNI